MCAKNSHVKKKKKPSSSTRKRARPKTRKLKYLSLKLELSNQTQIQNQTQKQKQKQPTKSVTKKKQLNLFPLRPENLVQDNKDLLQDDQNVAFLFETATDDTSTTLQGLLSSTTTTTTVSEEEKVPELPFNDEESSLVRSAMRGCKQRDASEERYVSYWEVVEKREQADDVSSCSSGGVDSLMMRFRDCKKKSLVGLKLDYEEVLNAWSNKGPLYLPGDLNPPQTVPQLNDPATKALLDGWDNLWTVPEMEDTKTKREKEGETKEAILKSEQREASVLRYKEKRRNRLFSKRIRYEVRKLNAEKRPRVKGRFVKRDEDE